MDPCRKTQDEDEHSKTEYQSGAPALEACTRRPSVCKDEKPVLDKENMLPTGSRDGIEPADETIESMAQAAAVSHQGDEVDDDDDDTVSVSPSMTSTTTASGKKKKKRRSKGKRGIGKPTGFEEYFVDGPLTPAQHAQDVEDFSPDLPFVDRILCAIQRFEQSKRMESQRRDIFYKYLAYGGIDVGPNMFQGAIDAEGLDKDSLSVALAQTSIGKDKFNINTPNAEYAVDFSGCVSGFLSRRAMFYYGFETRQLVELVTSVLEKFMNYLLHHNVCPEYESDIYSARQIIQKATNELYSMAQISNWLPGDFNRAASTLFGGTYATKYDGISSWDPEDHDVESPQPSFIGFTPNVAHQIFGLAIATVGTEKQYEDFVARGPTPESNAAYEVIEIRERAGFEITDLVAVTEANLAFYKQHSKEYRPVGIMHARPWRNKASDGLADLTPAEREAESQSQTDPLSSPSWEATETYTFFVEGAAQQFLFVGMKLEATIHRLRCGIWFMDDFLQAFCSFDVWLCNELMVGWKEPRIKRGVVCWRGEGMGAEDGDGEGDGEKEGETRAGDDPEIKAVSDTVRDGIVNGTAE